MGNENYPCSYLHNFGDGKFCLSVIIEPEPIYIIANYLNKDSTSKLRQIFFGKDNTGEGDSIRYPIAKVPKDTKIEISIKVPGESRICELECITASNLQSGLPASSLYLPHLYLVNYRKDLTLDYQLYVKIPASGFEFHCDTNAEKTQFTFRENVAKPYAGPNWFYDSARFKNNIGAKDIFITVYDRDNTLRGKGTIRHSAADNKPFDLLTCE